MKTVQKTVYAMKNSALSSLCLFFVLSSCVCGKRGVGGDDEKISAETGKSKWRIFFIILKFAVAVKCSETKKCGGWVRKRTSNDEKVPFCCGKLRVSLLWGVAAEET